MWFQRARKRPIGGCISDTDFGLTGEGNLISSGLHPMSFSSQEVVFKYGLDG